MNKTTHFPQGPALTGAPLAPRETALECLIRVFSELALCGL